MARLWQSGFELNSTTVDMEFQASSGTVSIQSSTVRSGTYAGRANPTAGTGFFRQIVASSTQTIAGFFRFYVYIGTLPGATINLCRFSDNGNNRQCGINLNADGTLQTTNSSGTSIGSASSALNINTWYMIELQNDSSTSPGTVKARLNGTEFASGANDVQGAWDRVLVGSITPAQTDDLYFDDLAVNDSSGVFQNSYPGSGKIIHLHPDSLGDNSQWSRGGADSGQNWSQVNEITPNDDTNYNSSATLNQEDLFDCQPSNLNNTDTINTVLVGSRFKNAVADAVTEFKIEIEKVSGGTILQSAAIVPNSTTWRTNATAAPFQFPIISYQDPDSVNWTNNTLNTTQIGYKITTGGTNAIRVSTMWLSVDYTPSSSTNSTLPLLRC